MSLQEFHFIRPYWLLALIPYGLLFIVLSRNLLKQVHWTAICDAALLPFLLQNKAATRSRWSLLTGAAASFLAIIALAGPTWERLPTPAFRNDAGLVIAFDLSRSMDAEDIKPSRLIRARYKIADILKQRKDGQTALLVYAGEAFTVTPLTDDTETILSQLEALTPSIMPKQGSNAVQAIEKASRLIKQAGLQQGQIILVTDAVDQNHSQSILDALQAYSLSILGVGSEDGAPIASPEGGFLKDKQGHIIIAKLNAADLMALADQGHGHYQTITADDSDIKQLMSFINRPSVQQDGKNSNTLLEQWSDAGPWLIVLILPLAALGFRRGLLAFAFICLIPVSQDAQAFDWQDLWLSKDQQAQEAYNNQQYERAAQLFENPHWKSAAHYKAGHYNQALEALKNSPKSPATHYNRGNALAQAGQLTEAIEAYQQALSESPNDTDAQYNKQLVEKELEKQQHKNDMNQPSKQKPEDHQSPSNENSQASDQSQDAEPQSAQKSENSDDSPKQNAQTKSSEPQAEKARPADENQASETQQAKDSQQPDSKQSEQARAAEITSDETKQANEQWLKRIPDDPAGLLKRKFNYQYNQRQHDSTSETGDW
jgi:Ca-activated chloride channel family protein